jgi:hypothetical protein
MVYHPFKARWIIYIPRRFTLSSAHISKQCLCVLFDSHKIMPLITSGAGSGVPGGALEPPSDLDIS